MNSVFSSEILKAEAQRLGFFACGIARAAKVEPSAAQYYRRWIADGGHADMHYLEANLEKRLDPTLLLPGARSIVVVALNYAPARRIPDGEYQLAVYAYGQDYHDVLKARLRQLMASCQLPADDSKIATDTVPLLERYWAVKAGLGFIGRNHQLIIPRAGSMFFLGEIVTTAEADHYDQPSKAHCGACSRCIEACPTGALGWGTFDSAKCLSYQTIENRNDIDEQLKDKLGSTIYGCDRCQQQCPFNRLAQPGNIPELQPSDALLAMHRDDWHRLSPDDYRRLFKGSAVKRAKYEGLMRNIRAVADKDSKELK